MAKWKLMTKKMAVIAIMAAMMIGSSTTAFAQSNEKGQTNQNTEAAATTETTESTDDHVLEETKTTEEESGEGIDRSNAFSVPGNGQVLDDIKDGSTKEFLTIVTKNNQTFYVVIDRSSQADNVYMLSNIDEADLQEFLKEAGTDTKEESTPAVILPEKEVTDETADETESKETKEEETKKDPASNAGMGLILVVALGALAAGYYFKIYKPKKNVGVDTGNEGLENMEDYDEVDEDEE